MVRALLAGTKTQTRRVVKPQPPIGHAWSGWCVTSTHRADEGKATWAAGTGPFLRDVHRVACPYGQPGDRLWVRETFITGCEMDENGYFKVDENGSYVDKIWYRASDPELDWWGGDGEICHPPWKPSIHMPRAASRLTLEITGVSVERLRAISEADAWAEGVAHYSSGMTGTPSAGDADAGRVLYRRLWESINGPGSWDANPWVWVVELKRAGNGGEG